ncbi:MAG: cyanophycin synthetase [Chitinophagaceae bacterium]|nr:MAG: cyanophycin synthetase [Chitinophagaceae bacterium]
MKILELKVLRGPNYWSVRRPKLIQMKLDLEELEQLPTNKIPGFRERIEQMLPSMIEHRCSESRRGGFFHRVEEGTWMGHVVEHIALELQSLAGMNTGFGRTRSTGEKEGVYYVVFNYEEEDAGVHAAKAAVRVAQALTDGTEYDVEKDIQELREIREETRLGPSTGSIVNEAAKRNIPFIRLNKHSLVQLGYGVHQRRIRATIASTTSSIAVDLACDKEDTKNILEAAEVPVPKGVIIRNETELQEAIDDLGYPIVLKPIDGNHGKGATTNIVDWEGALRALEDAQKYGRSIICERFITGVDFRLLVINYKFICAARRTPAAVWGDGKSTIQQLIDETNKDPRRGYGHEKVLTQITVDNATWKMLNDKGYTLETVPAAGEEVWLKPTANLSTGGTSTDVTEEVHPANVFMAERIARLIGLDICGIDIMAENLSEPLAETGGAVLEVNAAPGFRMHVEPSEGIGRNVAEPVVDMLFPQGVDGRIPIIAITGTNGKTTTTRITAAIVRAAGRKVGYTTSDGIYIQNQKMMDGDTTGPVSAQFVLKDPTVDFAVLECARGGILRGGLGFQQCDVAIVTNIAEDHLGMGGINTVEQMARVKQVVPETVSNRGFAILNADDDLVYKMKSDLSCNIGLFSMREDNPRVLEHCARGGKAVIFENGYVTIMKENWKVRVLPVKDIPVTYHGKAMHNIANVLPAVLATYLFKAVTIEDIRHALRTFEPSAVLTPGRLNFFHLRKCTFLADFAHNPAGVQLLSEFVAQLDYPQKIGVITGTGDRRDEDIRSIGAMAAAAFDQIILRMDKNLRGRSAAEIEVLLREGVHSVNPELPVLYIADEMEALRHAYEHCQRGALVTALCDKVDGTLSKIRAIQEEEEAGGKAQFT